MADYHGLVEKIGSLLEEAKQVEQVVSSLQAQQTAKDPAFLELAQQTYLKWLHESYALLPEFYRPRFWEPYEGITQPGLYGVVTTVGIKQFITNPLLMQPKFALASIFAGNQQKQTEYVWSHPYERYFLPQFKAQRVLLTDAREWYKAQASMRRLLPVNTPSLEGLSLHPGILGVAAKRFNANNFDDAVTYSIVAVNEAVREKSGSKAEDGVALMQHAFSPRKPLLRLSDKKDEQKAYMDLFASSWSALRNPRAHRSKPSIDQAHAALELIGFASALMRLVDEAEKINWGDLDT